MGETTKNGKRRRLAQEDMTEAMWLRRQNRMKRRRRFFGLILFIALLIGVYYGSGTDYFLIKTITIEGNKFYGEEDLLKLSKAKTGVNMFRVRILPWQENLLSDPYISEAKVRRSFPDQVKITVKERKEKYAVEYEGKMAVIDGEGVALRFADEAPEGFSVIGGISLGKIELGQTIEDKEKLENSQKALKVLSDLQEAGIPAQKIIFSDVLISIHIFDNLIFKTEYDNIKINLQNLKGILADLQRKGIQRGTIRGQDGDLAFSPLIE